MKNAVLLFLVFISGPLAFGQSDSVVTAAEAAVFLEEIQQEDVQLIDVRTPEEFEEGYLGNAENIDFHDDDYLEKFEKFEKNRPIYIYCRSGNRSGKAAQALAERGFTKIIDLQGGYLAMEELLKKRGTEEEQEK